MVSNPQAERIRDEVLAEFMKEGETIKKEVTERIENEAKTLLTKLEGQLSIEAEFPLDLSKFKTFGIFDFGLPYALSDTPRLEMRLTENGNYVMGSPISLGDANRSKKYRLVYFLQEIEEAKK